MFADLALIAVVTEAVIGYPDAVYRVVGHPVTWIGRLIACCDEAWNSPTLSVETRRLRGVATLLVLLAVAILAGLVVTDIAASLLPDSAALLLAACWPARLLAQRTPATHVMDVRRWRWSGTASKPAAGGVAHRRP